MDGINRATEENGMKIGNYFAFYQGFAWENKRLNAYSQFLHFFFLIAFPEIQTLRHLGRRQTAVDRLISASCPPSSVTSQ